MRIFWQACSLLFLLISLKAIETEALQDADNIKKNVGWEVKAVWKTDKLFILF